MRQSRDHARISAEDRAVLDKISADSLRGHLSFIASDLLEGRDSPSRGLDIAAEYIAAQFRRAGLQPIGDDGYFQTANMREMVPQREGFSLAVGQQSSALEIPPDHCDFYSVHGLNILGVKLYKLGNDDPSEVANIAQDQVAGRAIITDRLIRTSEDLPDKLRSGKPSLVIRVDRQIASGPVIATRRLIDPEERLQPPSSDVPMLVINDSDVVAMFDAMKPGLTDVTLSLRAPASVERPVRLRNVIGLLRGSDPEIADTYVLVTAHYDHLGMGADDKSTMAPTMTVVAWPQ